MPMPPADQLSPMMQQYVEVKRQHPNEIVFYRLGDFYEMFFDDAITAARELDLTLTSRACGMEERAPMCGVPYHSYESYLARLMAKGYKVAICEQMEDPATAKGLVKRDIIRVVTPGTILESSMLQDDRNNYICSVYIKGRRAGLCFADISTGTAHITALEDAHPAQGIIAELCRWQPREVLLNEGMLDCREVTSYIKRHMRCSVELMENARFAPGLIDSVLARQFGRQWESATPISREELTHNAVGALLEYLYDTQKKGVESLRAVQRYAEAQYMRLSAVARANLELTETMRGREKRGTLLWVLDKTRTAMGKRLLRNWVEQPLVDARRINQRLDAVDALVRQTVTRSEIAEELRYIFDMERLLTRTVYGSATPKEIYALAQTCGHLPRLKELSASAGCAELSALADTLDPLSDIQARICAAVDPEAPASLKDGGVIRTGFNPEVDELRSLREGSKDVLAQMETRLREETGIPKLKVGFNHVFGYYIEVSNSYRDQVPDTYTRKQTLTNGERYITPELKELENRILGAHERLIALERQIFEDLLRFIGGELARVQRTAAAVAQLDVLVSLAQTAAENNYCRPVVDDSDFLTIREGRHPVVEQMLQGSLFVPNDTELDCGENQCLVITGPNMAGKSTYMRQNALIALMAQMGSFVPARECRVGVVDAIYTRVGAADDLAAGQSTFMVEMNEVAEILRSAGPKSLVILDEIGRGTSTFDGMSIARAVVEYLCAGEKRVGCKTLFATHYHELTDMENALPGVKNYNIAVKKRGEDITFLRRIVRGPADDSYGIEVAKLAGLPAAVTRRAREVLRALEASAPDRRRVEQLGFDELEAYASPALPGEVVEKLRALDVDTLTPLEALSFLYELKKALAGSLNG